MSLPNRNGDSAESRVCSSRKSSSGPRASRSFASCFTLRTKAGRFTRGLDLSLATKCVCDRQSFEFVITYELLRTVSREFAFRQLLKSPGLTFVALTV